VNSKISSKKLKNNKLQVIKNLKSCQNPTKIRQQKYSNFVATKFFKNNKNPKNLQQKNNS